MMAAHPSSTSRAAAKREKMLSAAAAQRVAAFHPGPGPDFAFATPQPQTLHEALAAAEGRLLDAAIERFAGRGDELAHLVHLVINRRAEVAALARKQEN